MNLHLLAIPLGLILGAFARRSVGGWLSKTIHYDITDPFIRLMWACLMALVAFSAGLIWWQSLAIIPIFWVGSTTGMFSGFTMGRKNGRNIWLDTGCMLVYGSGCLIPLAVAAFFVGLTPLFLISAAVLCPVIYELAWLFPLEIPALGCYHNDPVYLTDPPPTAELFWGAIVGMAVAATVLF